MKKLLLFSLLSTTIGLSSLEAQHNQCGTSTEDLKSIYENMVTLRERHKNEAQSRAIVYIPVYFHLVAKDDGTSRVREANVLDMLCGWNQLFAANNTEMQFYLKGFTYINRTSLYDAPRSFAGQTTMRANKKTDGMNVFITNNAGDGTNPNIVVLAYYANKQFTSDPDYTFDWIVCIKNEVSAARAATIAHEAGHMYSLPHTFYGWESESFTPTAASPCAPGTTASGIATEKFARTGNTANCSFAADGFCDTQADYNFGLTRGTDWNNNSNPCVYNGIAKDPDCVALNPDENNMMGYFTNCETVFSAEQSNAMRNNYLNHPGRQYLRNGNITPNLTAPVAPTLVAPANTSTTQFFNNVTLDWDDVPGAAGYIVEVSTLSTYNVSTSFLVTASTHNLNSSNFTNMTAGRTIYWRVRPYGTYRTCSVVSSGRFTLGALNSVETIPGIAQFDIAPNPVRQGQDLLIQLNTEKGFEGSINLYNTSGQLVVSEKTAFDAGLSSRSVSTGHLSSGLYQLAIQSEKGVITKRVVIQ